MSPPPPLPDQALEPHVRQLAAIAELLLGAAQSDGSVSWSERSAIASVLRAFLGESELPDEVQRRLDAFDFAKFDLDAACKQLVFTSAEDRTSLLGLIARVTDADAILKIGERSFLKRVARAIGATDEDLEPFIVADTEKAPKKKTTSETLPHSRRNKRKL